SGPRIHRAIDAMYQGIGGRQFREVADSLVNRDPYMVLADFADYCRAQQLSGEVYRDKERFTRMALLNTAASGVFTSDRSIAEYAANIWGAKPLK
ncbi:MAG: glycogen/starch/alpha-glucan phosphorylase, partial [Clostridia bacterium]|nr:glycogen/starch/alpha-glucan phosphorylase [Clostridia bacterium]